MAAVTARDSGSSAKESCDKGSITSFAPPERGSMAAETVPDVTVANKEPSGYKFIF